MVCVPVFKSSMIRIKEMKHNVLANLATAIALPIVSLHHQPLTHKPFHWWQEDAEGTLSVNYTGLIPYMIEAAKEQQEQMDELKNENQRLKARLDKIERLLQK